MSRAKELLKNIAMFPSYFYKKARNLVSLENFTRTTMSQLSLNPQKLLESSSILSAIKVNDIVFVKPTPLSRPDLTYPSIGSSFEIDCKIVEIVERPGKDTLIKLISGHGVYLTVTGDNVVLPKDKPLYSTKRLAKSNIDTELFPKDTLFELNGDYFSSERYGVYIHERVLEKYSKIITEL